MQKRVLLYFVLVFFIFSSCTTPNKNQNKSVDKPTMGGSLNLSLPDSPYSFYPPSALDINAVDIVTQVYEGLVSYSPKTLEIIPVIAETWEVDEGNTQYTFHIKKGVFFHEDDAFANKKRELTANDVSFTLYNICTFNENNKIFNGSLKGLLLGADQYYELSKKGAHKDSTIKGINIIDDYTIQLTLTKPNVNFLNILAMPYLSIISKECFDKYGAKMKIGTGPFKLYTDNVRNNELTLIKNTKYHQKDTLGNQLPYLDSINFFVYNIKKVELEEFKKDNLDLIWGLPSQNVNAIVKEKTAEFKKDSLYTLKRIPELTTEYCIFNTYKPVFSDKRIRQAFNYAIDKNKIIEEILKGEAYTTGDYGIIPPAMKNYDVNQIKGYEFNVEKAKKLLAEAGYPNGEDFPEVILELNNDGRKNIPIAVELQKQLHRNLGIKKLTFNMVSLADKLEHEMSGYGDMFKSSWTADYPDPANFLQLFYGKLVPEDVTTPSYPNTSRFQNEAFDQIFEQALHEQNQEKRMDLLIQAEQIVMDNAPLIVLYYEENYVLLKSKIKGLDFNPLKYKNLKNVYIKK